MRSYSGLLYLPRTREGSGLSLPATRRNATTHDRRHCAMRRENSCRGAEKRDRHCTPRL